MRCNIFRYFVFYFIIYFFLGLRKFVSCAAPPSCVVCESDLPESCALYYSPPAYLTYPGTHSPVGNCRRPMSTLIDRHDSGPLPTVPVRARATIYPYALAPTWQRTRAVPSFICQTAQILFPALLSHCVYHLPYKPIDECLVAVLCLFSCAVLLSVSSILHYPTRSVCLPLSLPLSVSLRRSGPLCLYCPILIDDNRVGDCDNISLRANPLSVVRAWSPTRGAELAQHLNLIQPINGWLTLARAASHCIQQTERNLEAPLPPRAHLCARSHHSSE